MFAGSGTPIHAGLITSTATGMAPWFIFPAVLALLSIAAQRAFLFTPDKIAPKLNRISPISGVRNKLGRQGLFEFLKSSTKLVIYTAVLGLFLAAQLDTMLAFVQLTPAMIIVQLGQMTIQMLMMVFLIAAALGGIDYLWQQAEHTRKNRMSRKEMLDELKQSEGDPMMKQQRRQRGQEIAMNRMLVDVEKADVVIVNPTHYAVALQWDRGSARAPVCVAKGVDEVAMRIREVAMRHAVPIHSDAPTARALHGSVDIGSEIAPEHYRAVAAAIRFAEDMRKRAWRR